MEWSLSYMHMITNAERHRTIIVHYRTVRYGTIYVRPRIHIDQGYIMGTQYVYWDFLFEIYIG